MVNSDNKTPKQPACLIRQSACGRESGVPTCAKCGVDEDTRYITREDMDRSLANAKSLFWKNQALTDNSDNVQESVNEGLNTFWLDRLRFTSQNAYHQLTGWAIALRCAPDDMVQHPTTLNRKWSDRLWQHFAPLVFFLVLLLITACGKKDEPERIPTGQSIGSIEQRVAQVELKVYSNEKWIKRKLAKDGEKQLFLLNFALGSLAWFVLIFAQRIVSPKRIRLSKEGVTIVRASLGAFDFVKVSLKWSDVLAVDYDGNKWHLTLEPLQGKRTAISFQTGSGSSLEYATELRNRALFVAFALAHGRDDINVSLMH